MKQLSWHYAVILAIASVVLFTNLGTARLWDRDEPRNAGCAREMLERGDWVVPIFNDELRGAKPVLLYWLIMSAYAVFGFNEFAARFWSATLAVGTVLATYHIGRRLFSARAALWGALILSTSLMFDVAGRAATPDAVLIFCSTLAVMVYVLGTFQPRGADDGQLAPQQLRHKDVYFPHHIGVVALMYALMGLGVLAKGPVGLILPTAVIGMFLLIVRLRESAACGVGPDNRLDQSTAAAGESPTAVQPFTRAQIVGIALAVALGLFVAHIWNLLGLAVLAIGAAAVMLIANRTGWLALLRPLAPRHFLQTCGSMRPITAIVVAAGVALPWYLLVGYRTNGDFLYAFFLNEHFGRATTAMENHSGSPLFYPAAMLVGFFPWSVFAAPVLIGLVRQMRRGDAWQMGYVLLACWVCVYVGIFSLATTKLPSYVTPCFPAIALLTGCFVDRWSRGTSLVDALSPRLAIAALALVGLLMTIAIPIVAHKFLPGDEWLGSIGLILLAGAIGCYFFMRRGDTQFASVTFGATSIAFATVIFGLVTVEVDKHQQSDVLFSEIARRGGADAIGSYGCLESTWVYYARRPIDQLEYTPPAAPPAALAPPPALAPRTAAWKPRPRIDIATFFNRHPGAVVITTRSQLENLRSALPRDVDVLAQARYFFKQEDLVLLGRPDNTPHTAANPRGDRY